MAKVHLDRLRRKYGYTGGRLERLMQMIMAENSQSISNAVGRVTAGSFEQARNKLPVGRQRRFVLPDVSEVLPKRSVFVRKAAEKGTRITDTLRDALTRDLRSVLGDFTARTGEQTFVTRRGRAAGRINPQLVAEFEDRITATFNSYTKKDPKFGVPENVHNIAVTEVRSAADEIKFTYTREFLQRNPDIDAEKVWIHNRQLVRQPRQWHMDAEGQRQPMDKPFVLENPDHGTRYLMFPHAPGAPADEVIGCQCDFDIVLVVPRQRPPARVAKAEPAEVGETRERQDGTYRKVGPDKWVKVGEGEAGGETGGGPGTGPAGTGYGAVRDSLLERANLSAEESDSVDWYTGTGAVEVNEMFREAHAEGLDGAQASRRIGERLGPHYAGMLAALDGALARAPGLPEDTTLYRGGSFSPEFVERLRRVGSINDPAFMSTTMNRGAAQDFAGEPGEGRVPVVFEIAAPRGKRALPAEPMEQEILLKRRTSVYIDEVSEPEGGRVVVRARLKLHPVFDRGSLEE